MRDVTIALPVRTRARCSTRCWPPCAPSARPRGRAARLRLRLARRLVEVAREPRRAGAGSRPAAFSHGGTRNALCARAAGAHVAFLTQDATPAGDDWLARLLGGFERPTTCARSTAPTAARRGRARRPRASSRSSSRRWRPTARRSSTPHPDGAWRDVSARASFFTDANGAVARWAWERVPFRDVAYAEDRLLALRMLGPASRRRTSPPRRRALARLQPVEPLRRCFDEWRGLREIYGHVEPPIPADARQSCAARSPRDRAGAGRREPSTARWTSLPWRARPPLRGPGAGRAARVAGGPPAPGGAPAPARSSGAPPSSPSLRDHRSRRHSLNRRPPTPPRLVARAHRRAPARQPAPARVADAALPRRGARSLWRIVTFPLRFTPLRHSCACDLGRRGRAPRGAALVSRATAGRSPS